MTWLAGKTYRKSYTITPSSEQTNVTYQFTLTRDSVNCINADFTNIICYLSNTAGDNVSILPSYARPRTVSIDINGTPTYSNTGDVFIKFANIPPVTGVKFYIYTGGETVHTQDIANGFVVGDEFGGTAIDFTKWYNVRGRSSVINGMLKLWEVSGGSQLKTKTTFSNYMQVLGEVVIAAGQKGQVGFGSSIYVDSGGDNVIIVIQSDGMYGRINGKTVSYNTLLSTDVIGVKRFGVLLNGAAVYFKWDNASTMVWGDNRTLIPVKVSGGYRASGVIVKSELRFNWIGASGLGLTTPLNVANTGWIAYGYSGSEVAGEEYVFAVRQDTGSDQNILAFPTWDFGDGSAPDSTGSTLIDSGSTFREYTIPHTYVNGGTYVVKCYDSGGNVLALYGIVIKDLPVIELTVNAIGIRQLPLALSDIASVEVDESAHLVPTSYIWKVNGTSVDTTKIPTYIIPNLDENVSPLTIEIFASNSAGQVSDSGVSGTVLRSLELRTDVRVIQRRGDVPLTGVDEYGKLEFSYAFNEIGERSLVNVPGNIDWSERGVMIRHNITSVTGFIMNKVLVLRTRIRARVRRGVP